MLLRDARLGLVHLLGVEYFELNEKVKIFYRQTSDCLEQVRLDLGNHVLQRVLSETPRVFRHALRSCGSVSRSILSTKDE